MTDVIDVLTGSESVIVKTESSSHEFERDGYELKSNRSDIPIEVLEAVNEEGFEVRSDFPKEVTLYAHDEPTPHVKDEVARDLSVEEGNELAARIANITYEVSIDVKVYEDGSYEVTHVFGKELEEPYSA